MGVKAAAAFSSAEVKQLGDTGPTLDCHYSIYLQTVLAAILLILQIAQKRVSYRRSLLRALPLFDRAPLAISRSLKWFIASILDARKVFMEDLKTSPCKKSFRRSSDVLTGFQQGSRRSTTLRYCTNARISIYNLQWNLQWNFTSAMHLVPCLPFRSPRAKRRQHFCSKAFLIRRRPTRNVMIPH